MASIFSNFGNKIGNAFTNLGQGNSLLANQSAIANLSDEDKKKLQQQGLQKFADTMFLTSALGSGDSQKIALAQNKIRQRQLDQEDAKRKADQQAAINEYFGGNEDLLKFAKTFGTSAALQRQQNLQAGEMAGLAEQRKIQSLVNFGYTPEQANAIVIGGLKPEEVQGLNQPIGQNIIDETNEIVDTLNKDTGMQNDYSNLDQAFGPVDALQENVINKPARFLFGADPASDTAAAIRDRDNLNLEILATLANDYTGRPSNLLLGEIKKNIPEGSATSEADAFQKYSNFKIQTQSRIANLEQGILSDAVGDATKEKYREELVKSKVLLKKLEAATASLAPKDSVSVEPTKNFVSEGKYNNYFINEGN
tara:strand:+ start:158 stop:1255 length:1098 start_codon:yes stop_codon:yes gene_type:complete